MRKGMLIGYYKNKFNIVIAAHNVEREADLKIDEEICMSEGVITKILKREA